MVCVEGLNKISDESPRKIFQFETVLLQSFPAQLTYFPVEIQRKTLNLLNVS